MPSQIDNIIIQVRSRLQELSVKLWLDPYYFEDIGPIDTEIDRLARDFSSDLRIPYEYCRAAISELQDGALSKLRARKEFQDTGLATFKVRAVQDGKTSVLTVKCMLTDIGERLHEKVAQTLKVNVGQVKLISSGRVIQHEATLADQRLGNNQQIMALISTARSEAKEDDIYNRVKKAKDDAELIITSKQHNFFTMEDQDGNAIHLPPNERKAIMLALALFEKGKSAMKKEKYDEALVLLLEADEQFSSCNSKILESADNYALLNLDIVWCYLCLKSVTHLPDAERRLDICEQHFRKSYGENFYRLIALKGSSANEKALLMRLHLLQGVVLFHQNRRNEAHEKLSIAEEELRNLQLNETSILTLIEMGYNLVEARTALRACNGNIHEAVCYITDRREKRKEARKKSKVENSMSRDFQGNDDQWINPRSICTLVNMGFQKEFAAAALKRTGNDLDMALDLLQKNRDSLIPELPKLDVDEKLVQELTKIGFNPEIAKLALESTFNNSQEAVELLLKLAKDGNFNQLSASLLQINNEVEKLDQPGPSTTMAKTNDIKTALKEKIDKEMAEMKAYERFSEDITVEDDEYLDLPLIQEEHILLEYKTLLEQ